MRSKVTAIVFGVALVGLGIVLSGNTLGWWSADIFFDGWWTLFLIVPALVSIIGQRPNPGNLILLGIGLLLLADAQQVLGDVSAWSLLFPLIVVIAGATILWKGLIGPKPPTDAEGRPIHPGSRITAVFSGQTAVYNGLPFTGAVTVVAFGSMELDLRGAIITEDVLIDATTLFGSTEIMVPPGTIVDLDSVDVLGGSESKAPAPRAGEAGPVVHVRSTAAFGGLDVVVK